MLIKRCSKNQILTKDENVYRLGVALHHLKCPSKISPFTEELVDHCLNNSHKPV